MIQITPQMRILVAVEAVDFRKGIDCIGRVVPGETECRSVLGLPVCVPQPAGNLDQSVGLRRAGILVGDQATIQRTFRWWPTGKEPARALRAHQAQVLLAAGNPEMDAAPVWRKVS